MRDIPEDLAARIESGAARLCHAWIVTRADGGRLGFTDYDRVLEVDGVTCSPSEGWRAGASEAEVGGAAGTATAEGAAGGGSILWRSTGRRWICGAWTGRRRS